MGQIKELKGKIVFKHQTEAEWHTSNNGGPVQYMPAFGEKVLYDPDEKYSYTRVKYGDGEHIVAELPFSVEQVDWEQEDPKQAGYIANKPPIEGNEVGGLLQKNQGNVNYSKGVVFGANNQVGAKITYVNGIGAANGQAFALYVSTKPNDNPVIGTYQEIIGQVTLDYGIAFEVNNPENRNIVLVKGNNVFNLLMSAEYPFQIADTYFGVTGAIDESVFSEPGECYFYLPGYPDWGVDNNSNTNSLVIGENNKTVSNNSFVGGLDSVVEGDVSFAFGNAVRTLTSNDVAFGRESFAGSKVTYYKAIDITNKKIYLTKTQTRTPLIGTAEEIGAITPETGFDFVFPTEDNKFYKDEYFIRVLNVIHYDCYATIASYEDGVITYTEKDPSVGLGFTKLREESDENFNPNDYSIMFPQIPWVGMVSVNGDAFTTGIRNIATGESSFASGVDTVAAGDYAHTEGRRTYAAYAAHAEGYDTKAYHEGSHSEGRKSEAWGDYSHAEGFDTLAFGNSSHAEGNVTEATGRYAHSEGSTTKAKGNHSHAEGYLSEAQANSSHAEGTGSIASYHAAHAEGWETTASGEGAHTEGRKTSASGAQAHAEGYNTIAKGLYSHAEGNGSVTEATAEGAHAEGQSTASGKYAHSEGVNTIAQGNHSHAEGYDSEAQVNSAHAEGHITIAKGVGAHAEGQETTAEGQASHAEGYKTFAQGTRSHAEGTSTKATTQDAHAEGNSTTAVGKFSHAEGNLTSAGGESSHAEGINSIASGKGSHAEGNSQATNEYAHAEGSATVASGKLSHAEGFETKAEGNHSHAEGYSTEAKSNSSHAEGHNTTVEINSLGAHAEGQDTWARAQAAHAEGYTTQATGAYSHAEGENTLAEGKGSHAEGWHSYAAAPYSHASGVSTRATAEAQTVVGKYNSDNNSALFIVGNGTSAFKPFNAFEVISNSSGYAIKVGNTTITEAQLAKLIRFLDTIEI